MFEKIKKKIKLAKIAIIAFGIIFWLMIISNVYLNYKVLKLENQILKIKK
jgi:hemolysin-activating ACP:hemolysin acyltransferase